MRPVLRCMPLPVQLQALGCISLHGACPLFLSKSSFIINLLKLPFSPIICLIYLIFTWSHAMGTKSLTRNPQEGENAWKGGWEKALSVIQAARLPGGHVKFFLHLKLYESRRQIVYLILCDATPSKYAQGQSLG